MRFDFYTKFILTVVAICLVLMLFKMNSFEAKAGTDRAILTSEAEKIITKAESKQRELVSYAEGINSKILSGDISAMRANAVLQYAVVQQNDILISINSNILKVLLSNNEILKGSISKK